MPSNSEPTPRMTLCLAIDLKGSTAAGLRLSTRRLDRFNLALVRQFTPHLMAVGLEGALVKFAGDGWLVVTDDTEHAAPLCCLAIIMSCRFQAEIAREAGIAPDEVPALRLAVCWGRDLPVELPGGQRDFVGDSVRHAVRACQFCHDNEILIDDTVLRWVHHDFATAPLPLPKRREEFPGAKVEQEIALHVLEGLRSEAAADGDAPEYFVNTLAVLGRQQEAEALAGKAAATLQSEAAGDPERRGLSERFNRLLASSLDYETINRLLRDMREAGLTPDVRAFNSLIAKAADDATRSRWLQRMRQAGVTPDIKTYNLLIEKAADEAAAGRWLSRMRKAGVAPDTRLLHTLIDRAPGHEAARRRLEQMEAQGVRPDATAYDLLIEKAPDIASGRVWIERMFHDGLPPTATSFKSLFARNVGALGAEELLTWFLALPVHPPEAMWQAIAEYRKAGRIPDALRLCLDYPHTQAAQRVFRAHPEQTLAYFEAIVRDSPSHANGAYALGQALLTLGRPDAAAPWLRKALALAAPGPRRDDLLRLLGQLTGGKDAAASVSIAPSG